MQKRSLLSSSNLFTLNGVLSNVVFSGNIIPHSEGITVLIILLCYKFMSIPEKLKASQESLCCCTELINLVSLVSNMSVNVLSHFRS
jgi:hypothetical protein